MIKFRQKTYSENVISGTVDGLKYGAGVGTALAGILKATKADKKVSPLLVIGGSMLAGAALGALAGKLKDKEIEKLKAEANKQYKTGKKLYRQAGAYILMLNTGLRAGEMLGVLNADIDLERRVLHLQRGVKVVNKRDGVELLDGSTEVKVGKLKSATSKRDIPLNDVAIQMIKELREEFYFGEDNSCIKK